MKTLSQYREEIKNLMDSASKIDAQCIAENRDPTPEELNVKNQIFEGVEKRKAIVANLEQQERLQQYMESPANPPATVPQDNGTAKPKGHRIDMTDSRSKDRFGSLGEQIAAVIRAGSPGGSTDPRLMNAASGLNETVPSEGGFLIQQDFAVRELENLFDNGIVASRCDRVPISANSNGTVLNGYDETTRSGSTAGGIIVYMADEAAEKTASKPKFRRVEINLKKMIGLCYLTDELMMDAPAMESRVSRAFQGGFDEKLQDQIVNGTGAGQLLGLMNAGCKIAVAKETGQAAATILTQNIVKMFSRRFAAQTGNYIWLYNQMIEPQLSTLTLDVGTGGIPVFMPPGGISAAPYGTIMGRPAFAIEQCQALGTEGDIILANFNDGYILGEKGGLMQDMSIHVRFIYDESVLRFVLRIDGQPWRASALTPKYGGANATQSHFITLATRS
ncbi:MAG: phage major capsid protein [Gammaproteobacteria bacterium]